MRERVMGALRRASTRAANLANLRGPIRTLIPPDLAAIDPYDWLPRVEVGHEGIDLDPTRQLEQLRRWGQSYGELFAALRADRQINVEASRARIHNGWYGTPDAEVYAAIVADRRPAAIVEVGGGFSTLVARRAAKELGLDTQIVVVDPEPRTDVRAAADQLLLTKIETVAMDELPLDDGGILFVDSTHVARSRGDVPHLFNRVIPALAPSIAVHVHDVFIPFDYPDGYRARMYSEQYVLQALLCRSPTFRTIFATHYMGRRNTKAMREALGAGVATDERFYGGSYWFELAPPSNVRTAAQ
jgi:hypothetical protein